MVTYTELIKPLQAGLAHTDQAAVTTQLAEQGDCHTVQHTPLSSAALASEAKAVASGAVRAPCVTRSTLGSAASRCAALQSHDPDYLPATPNQPNGCCNSFWTTTVAFPSAFRFDHTPHWWSTQFWGSDHVDAHKTFTAICVTHQYRSEDAIQSPGSKRRCASHSRARRSSHVVGVLPTSCWCKGTRHTSTGLCHSPLALLQSRSCRQPVTMPQVQWRLLHFTINALFALQRTKALECTLLLVLLHKVRRYLVPHLLQPCPA